MADAHDTHCCLEHGCKYGDEGCPVAKGVRKQHYPCERCGLETEGYYGEPERTRDEQQEFLDALWEQKQNPRTLSPQEKLVVKLAKQYGRARLQSALAAISMSGLSFQQVIEMLGTLKHIK